MESIADHHLESLLCRGASSEVWTATRMGPAGFATPVALKTLTDSRACSPEHVRAFINEANAGSYVQHRNVVQTRSLFVDDGRYWLSMELVRGWSMRALLAAVEATGQPMPIPVALSLARDVAAGLQAVHDAGLLHRNVTPDNLMVAITGHAVVLDFGCATWTLAEKVRFTPPLDALDFVYASPEMRARFPVDARADVFSLGALLHQLVPLRSEVPIALDGIIRRALDPDTARRFPSAHSLGIALELVSIREEWLITPSYVGAYLHDVLRDVPQVAAPPRPVVPRPVSARPAEVSRVAAVAPPAPVPLPGMSPAPAAASSSRGAPVAKLTPAAKAAPLHVRAIANAAVAVAVAPVGTRAVLPRGRLGLVGVGATSSAPPRPRRPAAAAASASSRDENLRPARLALVRRPATQLGKTRVRVKR